MQARGQFRRVGDPDRRSAIEQQVGHFGEVEGMRPDQHRHPQGGRLQSVVAADGLEAARHECRVRAGQKVDQLTQGVNHETLAV